MSKRFYRIEFLEKNLISKSDRFKINQIEKKEVKQKIQNKNYLIIGAAGSIGSFFSNKILTFRPKKVFFLDKDENELTELNRVINTISTKTQKEFICNDILNFDLKNFCKKYDINGIFNFSALKHVRSEENIFSSRYMLNVNSANFLNISYPQNVKYIFSVSTDKANQPTSLLGLSKKLMEFTLKETKIKNPSKKICSVRFTNVSFSKGSILKSIYDKCLIGGTIGIPFDVSRHFITHEEAVSLCLKSLLKNNENNIVLPNPEFIGKAKKISDLCKNIIRSFNIQFKEKNSGYYAKGLIIKFIKTLTFGQKKIEDLQVFDEDYFYCNNKKIMKTSFKRLKNYNLVMKIIVSKKSFDIKKLPRLIYSNFKSNNNNKIKISQNI